MRIKISKIILNSAMLLLIINSSCSEIKIRDVTENIHFSNVCSIEPTDNLIQFNVKKIELINVERFPNMWIEGGVFMSLYIEINNNTKKRITFSTVRKDSAVNSNFIGIVLSDTVSFFYSRYTHEDFQVDPNSSFNIQLTSIGGSFEDLFDYDDHSDNREPMYHILGNMCFFYETDSAQDIISNDVILLYKKRNLNIDKNTRVRTNSRIRIN